MSSISQSKKLLVIPSKNIKPHEYLCLVVLLETIRKDKEQTDIVVPQNTLEKYQSLSDIPKDNINVVNAIKPRKFILNFKKGEGNVNHVQWNQTEENISLFINMKDGAFKPEGMSFNVEGSDYDTVLYFNLNNFEEAAKVFEPYKNLINEANHVSIGKPISVENKKVELVGGEQYSTLSEIIFDTARGSMNKESINKLLASILVETKRLRTPIKNGKLFEAMSKMVNQGGSMEQANQLSDKAKNDSSKPRSENKQDQSSNNQQNNRSNNNQQNSKPNNNQQNQSNNQGAREATATNNNSAQQSNN